MLTIIRKTLIDVSKPQVAVLKTDALLMFKNNQIKRIYFERDPG